MEGPEKKISISYSLADQSFARTKSVGILNVSVDFLHVLARRTECERLTVFSNASLRDTLRLPSRVTIESHNGAAESKLGRIWWDQTGVYSAARRTGNSWLFLPKGFASFSRRCPVRLATFVHDVMQDHYDRTYPEAVSGWEAAYFRASFRASLRHSDVVFTPTQFVLEEIERLAREKGWKLPRLVCCGEGFHRPVISPGADRKEIIVFASRFPHKLTRVAVEFLSRWQTKTRFAGRINWIGSFPEKVELPAHANWKRHAPLPEAEFRALMVQARAVLFFSDYEGFGRPPVEAALVGAAPVYSDLPVTREVMQGCGYPFDNGNYDSFAAALDGALLASPEDGAEAAEKLMARHGWDEVANRVVEALVAAS